LTIQSIWIEKTEEENIVNRLCVSLLSIAALVSTGAVSARAETLMTRHVREATLNGQAKLLGHLPTTQVIQLDVVLPVRDQAGLDTFLADLYSSTVPNYRHFLTPAEFTARFGPTQEHYDAVVKYVQQHGLSVVGGSRDGMEVQVKGPVSAIEQAFHVNLLAYQHPSENRIFFAPDREPSVDLPFQLWHISGLDNFSIPHPKFVRKSDYAKAHGIAPEEVVRHATTGSGPSASFLGSDMRAAYYGGTALTGTGQNIALFEFAGADLADLATYYKNVGQTEPYVPTLISTGGFSTACVDSGSKACDDTEQTLDMTQAMGMAPGSTMLYMYVCGDVLASGSGSISDTACISAMVSTAAAPLSKQISCSWGWTPADPSTLDPYFEQMASQGQNFFAASGDSSAWSASNEAWPADDANIVSVGGTDLTTSSAAGPWKSETAWADSGGGISPDSIPIPSWQQLSGVITSSNKGSTTLRNGPDVSANANFTFYVCADQTTCTANDYGGTSFATPMWAGYLALANQQAAANGDTIGFIDPILYPAALTSSYGTYFHDVTSGSCGTFSGLTGYDLCTGWGSPNTTGIINLLAGSATPSFTLSDSPGSLSITQGSSGTSTITVNDAGGFTGSVTLAASGLPSGVTATFGTNPTTGTSVLTFTASSTATTGTSTVTITGTSGSLTASTTIALTVSAAASPNFSVAASPASVTVTQGASGTSTITITSTGGFNSATTLSATGLPSGVTAAFSTNPVTPAANGSATSTLTLTASTTATVGAATVTITGTSGSTAHSTTIALTVNSSGGTKNFTLSLSPSSFTIDDSGSKSTTLTVTSVNGFHSAVSLSVSGFPTDVSATASANPVTPPANGSVNVTITWSASRRAPTGTTTIELIGTSGSLTNETPVTITVAP
jgi:subtilase family serine protease